MALPHEKEDRKMVLRKYLQVMKKRGITAHDGERVLTVPQLRARHRANLNDLVIIHHLNGQFHRAEVHTAYLGVYLFSIQYPYF